MQMQQLKRLWGVGVLDNDNELVEYVKLAVDKC